VERNSGSRGSWRPTAAASVSNMWPKAEKMQKNKMKKYGK